jgi:zinc D-Ala-D-Ala carboxypeptidase
MILGKTFDLKTFTHSDKADELHIDNTQMTDEQLANLEKLHFFLIDIFSRLSTKHAKPINIQINSAYRSLALNKAVGGVPTSQHCKGEAADTVALGLTIDEYFDDLKFLAKNNLIVTGQTIHEKNRWVHISLPTPKHINQFMKTIDGKNYQLINL